MIKLIDENLYDFIKYINTKYPQTQEVYVTVCHGYDCIAVNDNDDIKACGKEDCFAEENIGFAVFVVEAGKPIITLAGEIPEDIDNPYFMHENFAHEYCHFLQYSENTLYEDETTENEAERFAIDIVNEYKTWKRGEINVRK